MCFIIARAGVGLIYKTGAGEAYYFPLWESAENVFTVEADSDNTRAIIVNRNSTLSLASILSSYELTITNVE